MEEVPVHALKQFELQYANTLVSRQVQIQVSIREILFLIADPPKKFFLR
jgi:hypothetical protein